MSKTIKWIIALGSASFLLSLSSYVNPEFARVLLSTILLLALIVSLAIALVLGFTKWRSHSTFWLVPSLACLAFLFCSLHVASPVAQHLSDKIFQKHLDDYSTVVSSFRDGKALCASSCNGNVQPIDTTSRPAHIQAVWGTHCDAGGAIVLFRADTDVPLLHEGYMFKDYEGSSNCAKLFGSHEFVWSHLPYVRHITGNWYRFSDQPGF